MPAKITLREA